MRKCGSRRPATQAGDGPTCAVLAGTQHKPTEKGEKVQQLSRLTPQQRRDRERAASDSITRTAIEWGRQACLERSAEYAAASLRLKAAANAERDPTSTQLRTLAASFDRRAALYAEVAQ